MIKFKLNGKEKKFSGDEELTLLRYLRNTENIKSVRDGCSGQAFCGACMVEMNGKPVLSCVTKMAKVKDAVIFTMEGFPDEIRDTIANVFVGKGAVQCGFCTPGFITRIKILLDNNPAPSREEIIRSLKGNYCRCTGYKKIVDAAEEVSQIFINKKEITKEKNGLVGKSLPKYKAFEKATGTSPYVDDLEFENMAWSALKFSDHPRAVIKSINTLKAEKLKGVIRIVRPEDIPGERYYGLIYNDWPLMIAEGETTRYIGDVIAGVVADTEETAREAVGLIEIEYEVLEPLTDMEKAEESKIKVHPDGNLLETCNVQRGGDAEKLLSSSKYTVKGRYETQRIEHAFLETEAAVAIPSDKGGIELCSQSQGIYEDKRQIAMILGIPEEKISVKLYANGGGFGGKEDMTVQGHVSLFAWLSEQPVKLKLTREESIRMHPKRHPLIMDYVVGCDNEGKFTALKTKIIGDTGAYASVGTKVLERAAGHATGAYHFPTVDIEAKTLYTNNIPAGAMRGFGVNQVTFAIESCIDELCSKGGFDRWQIRYDNALAKGSMTATGQVLGDGIGVRETLLSVRDDFYMEKYAGIACGIKNSGIGNGMIDFSEIKIDIISEDKVRLCHGWTEMGQGVDTIAIQVLSTETGIDPAIIEVSVDTDDGAIAGMTTSSRGTVLIGNGIIEACRDLKKDLQKKTLSELAGKTYSGKWSFEDSTKPGTPGKVITHYSYSYATQMVSLDETGAVKKVIAAHDGGKIINPVLFEGQVEGAVMMGLGYALSEELKMEGGYPLSFKLRGLGLPKIADLPDIFVRGVEVKDPVGPYGAKGIGEIGLVPTAAAVANSFHAFNGIRQKKLPLRKPEK
ncbi:MAG: selenium-dependent xanthine dehydrogenase [Acidobacteriota bacterium]